MDENKQTPKRNILSIVKTDDLMGNLVYLQERNSGASFAALVRKSVNLYADLERRQAEVLSGAVTYAPPTESNHA